MVALVIYRDIQIDDIAIQKYPLVGYAMTHNFVRRSTQGLGEAIVVEGRGIRLTQLGFNQRHLKFGRALTFRSTVAL